MWVRSGRRGGTPPNEPESIYDQSARRLPMTGSETHSRGPWEDGSVHVCECGKRGLVPVPKRSLSAWLVEAAVFMVSGCLLAVVIVLLQAAMRSRGAVTGAERTMRSMPTEIVWLGEPECLGQRSGAP